MPNNLLQLNYVLLESIAQKFKEEGENLVKLQSSTRQRVQNVHKDWIGEAAEKFFKEMDTELLPALRRLSQALFQSHNVTGEIMKIIQEADEETASYFTNLPAPGDNSGSSDQASENTGMTKKIIDTIHDMNVTTNKRYMPTEWKPVLDEKGNPTKDKNGNVIRTRDTFCNRFVQDYCKNMGIPFLKAQATPTVQWLKGSGSQSGWKTVEAVEAAQLASQGKVVLVGWEQQIKGHGHIAVVRPESTNQEIRIANVGSKNFENGSIEDSRGLKNALFFVHDP